jgi:hypothetical protein
MGAAVEATLNVLKERFATSNQDGFLYQMWTDGAPYNQEAFRRIILA